MRALDKKLFRDLWSLKGQVAAIAFVLAAGVATYVMAASTLDSLLVTQAQLYREFRFPDLFASLKRAPMSLVRQIAAIPGVRDVEPRVVSPANVELAGYRFPVNGLAVALPRGAGLLNVLHLRAGRLPEPLSDREIAVSDGFAAAHKLKTGTTLLVTIAGHQRRLTVVGVASTPEFVYQLAPGSLAPDFANYAILWMNPEPLDAAYNMTGAFNQVAARLELQGDGRASLKEAIDQLDDLLKPYGGLGAYGRKDQISHRYLTEEFRQLESMATLFPIIFLSVAAFLLNVVLTRLMATQRGQIAILKAFGYTDGAVVFHFLKLTVLIVVVGLIMGIGLGAWLGSGLANLYMDVYRFPYLHYAIRPGIVLYSLAFCIVAAMTGTIFSVLRSARESPAVAMQAAPPGKFRISIVERLGLEQWLSQPTRMIIRNLERRPMKSLFSIIGVAMSTGILILGGFWTNAVDFMVFAQLRRAQIEDLAVTFVVPVSGRALQSLESIPGISNAEPTRAVAARLRFQHRTYRTALQGMRADGVLRRLMDREMKVVDLPQDGVVLTDYLANVLGAKPGDLLTVELLEGNRAVRQLPLAGVVSEYVGVNAYMRLDSLNRFLREGDVITGAFLSADMAREDGINKKLQKMPAVAGTAARMRVLRSFYDTLAEQLLTFAFFNTILASTISIGVVYNTARITLSERSRELASLRVLGYTRGEVSYILLGELALLVFVAVPIGFAIGYALAGVLASQAQTELFRIPLVIEPGTYAFAALVVLSATAVSAMIVRRQVDHLDLVEVLKARD
jgi:putative ABC transport system permease protein